MSDAVAGDAVSKLPDAAPEDPATHAEAQSAGEVQSSEEDVGGRLGESGPDDERTA